VIRAARAALLATLTGLSLIAAVPTLDALYPAGAERGSTNLISVSGKFDPWPPKVWVGAPGVHFSPQTNSGKFTVTVSGDAEPGPCLVRLYNGEGVSEPRFFVVGDGPEMTDTEPNNHFERAQRVDKLPLTINGRLEKGGDVDSFTVQLRAGEAFEARVESHTLMSKLDGVLRLVTTNGFQLAWNHDFATLDPRLTWRATNDQSVIVQVYGFPHPATAEVRLYGGDSAFYRLHLTRSAGDDPFRFPEDTLLATNGVILTETDEPRFSFHATKDEPLLVKAMAAVGGSPLDPWLKIEGADGKEMARNDDAEGTRDPMLEWKAPADGNYHVVIGSLTHRGGPAYRYGVFVQKLRPDFRATLAANSLAATTDSTNTIKFALKRLRGFTNELVAIVEGLPEGVASPSTNLEAKVNGDVSSPLVVASNAPAFSGPVQLKVTDSVTKNSRVVPFPLESRTEDNGVPGGYSTLAIEEVPYIWLTIKPRPAETAKETAKK
jgi:hypothetical protein